MSRSTFGASSGDHVILAPTPVNPLLRPILNSGAVGTFWSAQTGGTQYTDLLDAATGQPITGISTDQYGRVKRFQGPDGILSGWADFGAGRVLLVDVSSATAAAAASATAAQNAANLVGSPAGGAITTAMAVTLARTPDSLIAGAVTRDANGAATSAPVAWPDGTPGTYTAIVVSSSFPGAVDSYSITYGSPVTKTYTQPTVTRDATSGAAVNVPAITVS